MNCTVHMETSYLQYYISNWGSLSRKGTFFYIASLKHQHPHYTSTCKSKFFMQTLRVNASYICSRTRYFKKEFSFTCKPYTLKPPATTEMSVYLNVLTHKYRFFLMFIRVKLNLKKVLLRFGMSKTSKKNRN